MRYLQLGSIISLVAILFSCDKIGDPVRDGEFYFINQTNHTITYNNLFEEYNLAPKATILIKQTQDVIGKFNVNDYFSPFLMRTKEPIIIKFNADKCLQATMTSENSILDIKSYNAEKINKYTYKFTYTFTEADYNRAVTCP